MKIWFWSIIGGITILAWACVAWPLYKKNKWIVMSFPVFAIGLYLLFGNSQQLQQYWAWQQQDAEVRQEMAKLKSPQELVDRLRAHLQQDPQSAQGWYLLGKLYLDQQQYAEAESALNQAHQLQPQSGEIIVALAKANFFNHQGRLTQAMAEMLNHVLESLPEPVDALNLLAINAYQQQDFHQAVSYWQKALALVQPDSPDSRVLLDMIGQAQRQE